MKIKCEVGMKFGSLLVIDVVPDYRHPKAKFLCDCGAVHIKARSEVVSGRWICKCWIPAKTPGTVARRAPGGGRKPTHGKSKTPVWRAWRSMKGRCLNPEHPDYKNYGGRGIRLEWSTFEDFYAAMGDPLPGMQIERINNNGNYCPSNCKWASAAEQSLNKRTSKRWKFHGVEYATAADAGKAAGISAKMFSARVKKGVPGYLSRMAYEPVINGAANDCTQMPPLVTNKTN